MTERVRIESDREEVVIRLPNLFGWLRDQIPEEFSTHMRAAQREQLLAMRCLLDAAIERTEQADQRSRVKTRTNIIVE